LTNIFYTNAQIEEILKSITIIVDTREQKNQHILDYFNAKGIKHINRKLDVGDYSFLIPDIFNPDILYDYSKHFSIERKGSLEEVSNNIGTGRTAFENELKLARFNNTSLSIAIEDCSLADICNGNYNTKYSKEAFIGSVLTFKHRYNVDFNFVSKADMGRFIYLNAYYYLRNTLV